MQEISLDFIFTRYEEYLDKLTFLKKEKYISKNYNKLSFSEFVELNFKGKYHII